jgi:serine/threonine protein kinase
MAEAGNEERSAAGTAASRYELLELIGKGSFGTVYRA